MKKILVSISILTIVCLLFFNNYRLSQKVTVYSNEKKELERKLDSIRNKFMNIDYIPFVKPKSNIIKLGEEYIARINLSLIDTSNLPIVLSGNRIGDSIDENSLDTLIYNKEYECFFYTRKPKAIGEYRWGGKLFFKDLNGKEREYFFFETIEVIE